MPSQFDVEHILEELSVKEKVKLLSLKDFWHTQEIERLSIPSIRFSDGPNGLRGTRGYARAVPSLCFPNGTALAATWNMALLEDAGKMMAKEAMHKSAHVLLGPTCNIQRGPLGGRGFESFSEEPTLSGLASANIINGIQSANTAATVKHFVCNDLEDERTSVDSIVSQRALREVYLKPFQLAIKYSNPKCVMSSYNKVNGEHVSQSKFLLNDVLREEWGWNGLIMSDWFGVYSIKASLDASLDLECPGSPLMRKHDSVAHAISAREISMDVIDARVKNILNLIKFALDSGVPENGPETAENNTFETSKFVRELAQEGIVLLKNENNLLPLKKSDNVAVIGPNAKNARICGGGSAKVTPYYAVDIHSGVAAKLGYQPAHAPGCDIEKGLFDLGKHSTFNGKKGVQCKVYLEPAGTESRTLVEEYQTCTTKMTLHGYRHPKIPGSLFYMDLEGEFTAPEDGDYDFKVSSLGTTMFYINGEEFIDDTTNQVLTTATIGACSVGGARTKALAKGETIKFRIEYGSGPTFTCESLDLLSSDGGAMYITFIKVETDEERIAKAVEVAASADKVVLCVGTSADWESEGSDRPDMHLPGAQDQLIEQVLKVNKDVVIVNSSGTPVTMPWIDGVPALVQGWFSGNESGNAIADVLFGDVSPSGKLSLTFPKKNEDNPAFLTFKSNNGKCVYGEDVFVGHRFYEKTQTEPLFPFGFGLSYTTFAFNKLTVAVEGDKLVSSVEITNTGSVAGAEVAQFYVSPPSTTTAVDRPLKELKMFGKVFLQPGESKVVTVDTPLKEACSYYDADRVKWALERGEYGVIVGNSSASPNFLTETFTIEKTSYWTGL